MIGLKISGDKALAKALHKLPTAAYNRVVKPANAKVMRPVLKVAKQLVPVEFGVLKESLGIKTKTYPKKGVVFTVVGPRIGFHVPIGKEIKKPSVRGAGGKFESGGVKTLNYVRSPTKYGHLVELGHGGPHPAAAHPYLRPAFDGQKATMLVRYIALIKQGMEREAKRAAK